MSKALTLELIHMKTKTNRIESIKNLNLWGNDLDDISIVNQMPALEVLSLSVNNISTLKDIQSCYNLKELYMRKNTISNLNEIRFLQNLRKLKILWLGENPIADHPMYRQFVIKCVPQVEKLDNDMVSADEKAKADSFNINDFDDSMPTQQNKISPPRREPAPQKKTWLIQESVQDDYDSQDNQYAGKAGAKVQRSPPQRQRTQQVESPRNMSPIRENFAPAGKIKRSPPRYENPNSTNFYVPGQQQQQQQQPRNYAEDVIEPAQHNPLYQLPQAQQPIQQRGQPSQYENVNQQLGRGQFQQYPPPQQQYQRAQTAKIDDYDRDEEPMTGQLQQHQAKQKKEGTRDKFRNENILCAIIALMKELDKSGLEFVKKDAEKRLAKLE